jgi:hypothetical protein
MELVYFKKKSIIVLKKNKESQLRESVKNLIKHRKTNKNIDLSKKLLKILFRHSFLKIKKKVSIKKKL